jgi:hypothetical protein
MDFAKEDPDSEKELDETFPQLEKIEDLEFKNMLSNEGDELCGFSDYSRSRRNRKLRLGFNADENVHHVGRKTGV